MNISNYFGTEPQLKRGYYIRSDIYACKDCGALVLEDDRDKHATQHDLRGILLERLGAMSHSHGVIA